MITAANTVDDCTLGIGLYTPAEAAMYARITTRAMGRWVFGDATGDAVFPHQIQSEERAVSFLDFVQAMAVRAIRTQHDMSLQKIRAAVDCVQQTHGIEYPFARNHRTFIISEGSATGELAIEINGHLIQISGKHKKQHLIGPIAELYMEQIKFGEDGLAREYTAWNSVNGVIRMDPKLRFGEPLVTECGYSAETLWEAVQTEGSIKDAAKAYGVSERDIRVACEYFDYLINRDVA